MIQDRSYGDASKIGKVKISSLLFALMIIAVISYFLILPYRNLSLRHLVVFIGSATFYALAIRRLTKVTFHYLEFFQFSILLAILLFGSILSSNGWSFELAYVCMDFLAFYILMSTDCDDFLSKKAMEWIFRAAVIIGIMLILVSRTSVAYVFEDGRSTDALVLGMTNPNLTAMLISGVVNILLINIAGRKHKWLIVVLMLALLYLLWLTNARTSIFAIAVVLVYTIFFSKKNIPNIVVIIPIILSAIFVPLYLRLQYYLAGDLQLLGKSFFSGREYVYREHLRSLDGIFHILFGNLGVEQFSNAHNAPLTIVCSIGAVGFIIVYYGFTKHLIRMNKKATTPIARVAIVCMMSVYIQSCAESLMLTGVFPSIVFMYLYTLMMNGISDTRET